MTVTTRNTVIRVGLVVAYLFTVVAAVYAVAQFNPFSDDIWKVTFPGGHVAPAAVLIVGVTLVLRDLVHETSGYLVAAGAVLVGAAIAMFFSVDFALASAAAFLIAEFLDLLVYQGIRSKFSNPAVGMLTSNAVSIPIDSALFLWLAFGNLDFFTGQVIGKSIATIAAVAVLVALGRVTLGTFRPAFTDPDLSRV